jgi:hypothetical protein
MSCESVLVMPELWMCHGLIGVPPGPRVHGSQNATCEEWVGPFYEEKFGPATFPQLAVRTFKRQSAGSPVLRVKSSVSKRLDI